jgi:hypothetical protein
VLAWSHIELEVKPRRTDYDCAFTDDSGGPMSQFRGFQLACVVVSALLLLALTGCGSSSKSSTATATSSGAGTPASAGGASVKTSTYNINLTHVAGASGAASASGIVVLSVKSPSRQLCWSVSPVKTFTVSTGTRTPTIITIQHTPAGTPSTPGVPLGSSYESSGCTQVPAALLSRLEANPKAFYLSIYNTGTGDAVRGQV